MSSYYLNVFSLYFIFELFECLKNWLIHVFLIFDILTEKQDERKITDFFIFLNFFIVGLWLSFAVKLFVNIPQHLRIQKINKCPANMNFWSFKYLNYLTGCWGLSKMLASGTQNLLPWFIWKAWAVKIVFDILLGTS